MKVQYTRAQQNDLVSGGVLEYTRAVVDTNYYTNDFTRRCPFINCGGQKIEPHRKMPEDLRRRTFSFKEAGNRKSIDGGSPPK